MDATSQKMYKLTGTATAAATGLGIMVKVMSGDKISILGKSFWTTQNTNEENTNLPLADIVAGMLATPGGAAAAKGVTVPGLTTGANPLTLLPFFATRNPNPGDKKPMAYINYILLDEQFQWAGGNYSRVTTSGQVKDHFTDGVMQGIPVTKNGYLYVYCSNQSPVSVFFDNLQIVHTRGPLIEETHYYPFGLSMSGISSKALSFGESENKKKYNGIEKIGDFGLEDYDAQFRELDPQIGRWWEVDPKTENQESISPYASMSDNPIKNADPLGDEDEECCNGTAAWNTIKTTQKIAGAVELFGGGPENPLADAAAIVVEAGGLITAAWQFFATDEVPTITTVKGVDNQDNTQKKVNNPDGAKGKPDHQEKVKELTEKAKSEAKEGEKVLSEKKIQGHPSNRRPDAQIVDENGKTRKVFEAERKPTSQRNLKREAEYKKLNVEQETHHVRPIVN